MRWIRDRCGAVGTTHSTSLVTTSPSGSNSSRLFSIIPARTSAANTWPVGVRIGIRPVKQTRMPRNDATPPIAPFTVAARKSSKPSDPPVARALRPVVYL